jgi:Abnormal spindle-like microcephaly-assoc'd, ASPM-SPD-2-Hydin
VTIGSQGGPYRSAVTLSCNNANLPPGTNCVFNPSTVTPGSGSVQATMTISTTASSLVGPATDRVTPQDLWRRLLPGRRPFAIQPIWLAVLLAFAVIALTRSRLRALSGAVAAVLIVALAAGEITARTSSAMASGIALFPASVTFDPQTVQTTTIPKLVSVTNIGADTLNIGGITTSPSPEFAAVSNCGTTLAAGSSCQVSVTFTPQATGSRTGTLIFTDDASGSPHQLNLSGTGLAAPSSSGGTPTGTYNITVTASTPSPGTLSHFASVTLVVQ